MIWIDTILKHVKTWNQNMTKYSKIWANGTKKRQKVNKPKSCSLDRFEQVERSKIDWKLGSEWDKPLYFNIKPEYRTMQGFGAHSPLLLAPLKMFDLPPCCLSRGSEEGFGRKFCYCMMPKSQPRLTAKPLNSLSATHSWFFAYDATKIWQKSWKKLSIVAVQYGRTGVKFSRGGVGQN